MAFLLLGATTARAFPVENGVVWPYEGTVVEVRTLTGDLSDCCDLGAAVGDRVEGTLEFASAGPGGGGFGVLWRANFPAGASLGAGFMPYLLENGSGGLPDRLLASQSLIGGIADLIQVQPCCEFFFSVFELTLVDQDGTAFDSLPNPRDPVLPPDFAPSPASFETAQFLIRFHVFTPLLNDT